MRSPQRGRKTISLPFRMNGPSGLPGPPSVQEVSRLPAVLARGMTGPVAGWLCVCLVRGRGLGSDGSVGGRRPGPPVWIQVRRHGQADSGGGAVIVTAGGRGELTLYELGRPTEVCCVRCTGIRRPGGSLAAVMTGRRCGARPASRPLPQVRVVLGRYSGPFCGVGGLGLVEQQQRPGAEFVQGEEVERDHEVVWVQDEPAGYVEEGVGGRPGRAGPSRSVTARRSRWRMPCPGRGARRLAPA